MKTLALVLFFVNGLSLFSQLTLSTFTIQKFEFPPESQGAKYSVDKIGNEASGIPDPDFAIQGPSRVYLGNEKTYTLSVWRETAAHRHVTINNWSVEGGEVINTLESSVKVRWNVVGSGKVLCTVSDEAGVTTVIPYEVRVIAPDIPVVSGEASACVGDECSYWVQPIFEEYEWFVAGGVVLSEVDNRIVVRWDESSVSASISSKVKGMPLGDDEGDDASEDHLEFTALSEVLEVTINPLPNVFPIVGDDEINCGATAMYSVAFEDHVNYHWKAENGIILNGDSAHVATVQWTGAVGGEVKVVAENAYGCVSQSTMPVKVTFATAVDETILSNSRLFPNPTDGLLFVHLDGLDNAEDFYIQVTDLAGRIVLNKKRLGGSLQLDFSEIGKEGFYLVKIFNSTEVVLVDKVRYRK